MSEANGGGSGEARRAAGSGPGPDRDSLALERLDESQRLVCASDARLIAVASPPGTGKTTCLAARIVARIEDGVDPHRIAACTFTVRAARAMCAKLRNAREAEAWAEDIVDPQDRAWRAVDERPALWIGTTHDLAGRIVALHPDRIGRSGRMGTVGPSEQWGRMQQAMFEAGCLADDPAEQRRQIAACVEAIDRAKRAARPVGVEQGSGDDRWVRPTGSTRRRCGATTGSISPTACATRWS